ncbi:hypothetical protein H2203_002564 [Taxawa tesnikishii (nom. ined.)]|nr:hypothetical protein H2203_002564 [Dothideales sp. JES 119]
MSHNSTDYFEDLPLSGQALPQPQWKWMFRPSYLPAVSITILLVALSTRFLSSIFGASKPAQNGAKTIPFVPYWFPIIGHLPQMGLSADTFLDRARRTYKNGAFTLNLGGTTHSIIFHPALAGPFMNQKSSVADAEHVSKSLMFSNFGFPKDHSEKYDLALHDVLACYKNLLSEPSLGIMVGATVDALRDNIANLVGFVQSPVDMANWERTADVELKQLSNGEQVAEASLLP